MRPFIVLLLVLATVSSTNPSGTIWTKKDQALDIACPMPEDGEKLQVCSWRMEDEGEFKSSLEKANGNRIRTQQNHTNCMIRIDRVEEEDEGTWVCQVHYQNEDGQAVLFQNKIFVNVADVALELNFSIPEGGEKLQVCAWRNGDKGAFKSSFKKSHGDRISVYQNDSSCALRFLRVEEEDKGTWQCQIFYFRQGSSVEIIQESTIGHTLLSAPLANNSEKHSSVDKSLMKSSSIDRLSTLHNESQKQPRLDKASKKGSTREKMSYTNCTLENKSQLHSPLDTSLMTVTEPFFDFAYSAAISVSAGAGPSSTAEVGVAVGANAEVLVYASGCAGLKADVSVELDAALGFWNSLDDILGHYYMLGAGADINGDKSDETEANVKIIKNDKGKLVGATVSLGVGEGPDLATTWEVNIDHCFAVEVWRIKFSDIYEILWGKIFSKLSVKFMTILSKLTHDDLTFAS